MSSTRHKGSFDCWNQTRGFNRKPFPLNERSKWLQISNEFLAEGIWKKAPRFPLHWVTPPHQTDLASDMRQTETISRENDNGFEAPKSCLSDAYQVEQNCKNKREKKGVFVSKIYPVFPPFSASFVIIPHDFIFEDPIHNEKTRSEHTGHWNLFYLCLFSVTFCLEFWSNAFLQVYVILHVISHVLVMNHQIFQTKLLFLSKVVLSTSAVKKKRTVCNVEKKQTCANALASPPPKVLLWVEPCSFTERQKQNFGKPQNK